MSSKLVKSQLEHCDHKMRQSKFIQVFQQIDVMMKQKLTLIV